VKVSAPDPETVGVSPLLLLAAGLVMTLFTVSLAMAEPADDLRNAPMVASHDDLAATPHSGEAGLATDAITPEDTPILTRPLPPPNYHDRFRFYHRYDYALRARFNPIDEN
jgi:hypothetical protein